MTFDLAENIGRLFRTRSSGFQSPPDSRTCTYILLLFLSPGFKGSQFIVVSLKDGLFSNANVLFRARFRDGTSIVERTVRALSFFPHSLQLIFALLFASPNVLVQTCMIQGTRRILGRPRKGGKERGRRREIQIILLWAYTMSSTWEHLFCNVISLFHVFCGAEEATKV